MNDRIGWAIIGASQIARTWVANAIKAQPDGELRAIVSRDPHRARAFADEFGIPLATTSLDEVLQDPAIDAVYICTTNERHHSETLQAAAAGKHVLCEKPLALNVEHALEMVHACERAGVIFATNHHMRAAATHLAIRDAVRNGVIGRPLAARALYCEYLPAELQTWRTRNPDTGGVIFDLTTHNIDTLRFVLDDEPEEVVSMKAVSLIGHDGVEDQTQSVIRFGSGLLAFTHESHALAHHETSLEVHGTEGSLYGRGVLDERPVGRVILRRGSAETEIPVEHRDLYVGTVERFNAAIRGRGAPAATGRDGVRALMAALAIREAGRTGRAVTVPPLAG